MFDPNDAMVVSQPLPHVRLCAALDASCRVLGAHVGTKGVWGGGGPVRMMRGRRGAQRDFVASAFITFTYID